MQIEESTLLGKIVRISDTNPVYDNRKGQVIKVDQGILYIRFLGDTRIIGGFTQDMIEICADTNYIKETYKEQIARLSVEWQNDMDCWVREALAAYRIVDKKSK